MIPDVVSDVLDDPDGHITRLARALVDRETQHLWLTGCGDSAFAGQAAGLAFQRHTGMTATPRARAGPGPLPAPRSAEGAAPSCACRSRARWDAPPRPPSRHDGSGIPVFGLTNAADSQLGRAVDEVVPLEFTTLGFSPGTSTYAAMLGSLLRLAAEIAALRGQDAALRARAGRPAASPAPHPGPHRRRSCRGRSAAARPRAGRPSSVPGPTRRRPGSAPPRCSRDRNGSPCRPTSRSGPTRSTS